MTTTKTVKGIQEKKIGNIKKMEKIEKRELRKKNGDDFGNKNAWHTT